jgi:hypothetical protein
MYYSYVKIEYIATSFSPTRTDLALKLLRVFSNLSNFLLNWVNDCFAGLGFLPGGVEIGFHHSVFLIPAAIFGSVCHMCTPMFLAQLAGPLKTDFLGSLLCGSSTGPLSSCLVLVRSFLNGLRMGFLGGTHVLNSLKRSLRRTHVHGSHALFLQVVLILPLVRTHPENVTRQISLGERNVCRHHTGDVAWALVPAGQLRNVGVELLYVLYKLVYANPLGLLEHVGKVVLLLLSCIVQNTVRKWNMMQSLNDSRVSPLGPFLDTP